MLFRRDMELLILFHSKLESMLMLVDSAKQGASSEMSLTIEGGRLLLNSFIWCMKTRAFLAIRLGKVRILCSLKLVLVWVGSDPSSLLYL